MIRPARLALGAIVACLGAACSDANSITSPEESGAFRLNTRDALSTTPAAEPGPITSRLTGNVCADVSGENNRPGAALIAWQCHSGVNQQFTWQPSGEIRVFGDKCVDAAGGAGRDGDRVIIWTCHGGANQKWKLSARNEIRGIGDRCLAIEGGKATGGSPLAIRKCNGSDAQKWSVRTAAGQEPGPVAAPVTAPAAGSGALIGVAALPREYVQTSVASTPSGGRVIRVAAGGDLQAALDQAQLGDQVVLDAGATFVGNFVLRKKSGGSGWITIRSSGTLPAEGERMTAAKAGRLGLPKILTKQVGPAIATEPGAHHYRIMGVEIGATSAVTFSYSLVDLGTVEKSQNSLALTPHDLILDRVYVHGHAGLDFARCVALNSASSAVVDSYISECHGRGRDSQAIWGANGGGPIKIVNNYLEGAGEVVMFGGDDSRAAELLTHDVEIRRNHITRPVAWKGVWLVKNLLELKQGVRVLVEGNVLENHWADAQDGFAVVLKAVDQYGSAPWTT
ncbi:MAG: lectin, partial [Gemmatimonadaceae bacterium]